MKRKGSDQRRDEAMEEARGRHREEWEVQSEPQGLYAHSNFIVSCTIFMGMFFFHDLFPLFCWQMHTHTPTHTQTNCHHLLYQLCICQAGGSSVAIKDVVTLRITASPCYHDHRMPTFKKLATDVADVTPPSRMTSFAGLA